MFNTFQSLQMAAPLYRCTKCGEQNMEEVVINHIIKRHMVASEVPFYCMLCNKRLRNKGLAEKHAQQSHKGDSANGMTFDDIFGGRNFCWGRDDSDLWMTRVQRKQRPQPSEFYWLPSETSDDNATQIQDPLGLSEPQEVANEAQSVVELTIDDIYTDLPASPRIVLDEQKISIDATDTVNDPSSEPESETYEFKVPYSSTDEFRADLFSMVRHAVDKVPPSLSLSETITELVAATKEQNVLLRKSIKETKKLKQLIKERRVKIVEEVEPPKKRNKFDINTSGSEED